MINAKQIKVLFVIIISLFSLSSIAADNDKNYLKLMGGDMSVKDVELAGNPFEYPTEEDGEQFTLISLEGAVLAELACEGLNFNDLSSQVRDQAEQLYDYARGNWEMLLGNYYIFSQPQIAAVVQNANEILSMGIGATIANCQAARNLAVNASSEDWIKQQKNQNCLKNNGGNQLKCLKDAASNGDGIDPINTSLLTSRAFINDTIAKNVGDAKSDSVSKSPSSGNMDVLSNTCAIGEVSDQICTIAKKIIPNIKFDPNKANPSVIEPEMSIPEFVDSMGSNIKESLIALLNSNGTTSIAEKKDDLYRSSFGVAKLSNKKINALRELYRGGRKAEFNEYANNLVSLWSYRGARRLLNKISFGVQDGLAKTMDPNLKGDVQRLVELIKVRKEYLDTLEQDHRLSNLESEIWDHIENAK